MPRELREQQILDVAGSVFALRGYHVASMDEIAELADVSKPMLYAYFGSKEGLYVAYIDRTGRELLDRLVAAAQPGQRPRAMLRARIREFLAFVEQYRDGWRVLFSEMSSSRPLADEVSALRRDIGRAVRRMIEEGTGSEGALPRVAADGIAAGIVGAGESLANWWLEHPEIPLEEIADWYAALVQSAVNAAMRRATPGPARSGPAPG